MTRGGRRRNSGRKKKAGTKRQRRNQRDLRKAAEGTEDIYSFFPNGTKRQRKKQRDLEESAEGTEALHTTSSAPVNASISSRLRISNVVSGPMPNYCSLKSRIFSASRSASRLPRVAAAARFLCMDAWRRASCYPSNIIDDIIHNTGRNNAQTSNLCTK